MVSNWSRDHRLAIRSEGLTRETSAPQFLYNYKIDTSFVHFCLEYFNNYIGKFDFEKTSLKVEKRK